MILTFLFFFLVSVSSKNVFQQLWDYHIFQCLILHFHLIHVSILSTNLYLKHDNVCNCMFSYRDIQIRRRIGIIFGSFIRAPSWCDAGWHFAVVRWNLNIQRNWNIQEIGKLNLFLGLKYQINACPPNLNKVYSISCMFLLLLICVGEIEVNPGPRKNNTSCKFSFCHWDLNKIAAHNFSKLSFKGGL